MPAASSRPGPTASDVRPSPQGSTGNRRRGSAYLARGKTNDAAPIIAGVPSRTATRSIGGAPSRTATRPFRSLMATRRFRGSDQNVGDGAESSFPIAAPASRKTLRVFGAALAQKQFPAPGPDAMCFMLSKQGHLNDRDGHCHRRATARRLARISCSSFPG
jgi:hypothetical protein